MQFQEEEERKKGEESAAARRGTLRRRHRRRRSSTERASYSSRRRRRSGSGGGSSSSSKRTPMVDYEAFEKFLEITGYFKEAPKSRGSLHFPGGEGGKHSPRRKRGNTPTAESGKLANGWSETSHFKPLSRSNAKLIFTQSQMFATDVMNESGHHRFIRFYDFVEAMCRVASMICPSSDRRPLVIKLHVVYKDIFNDFESGELRTVGGAATDGGAAAVVQK